MRVVSKKGVVIIINKIKKHLQRRTLLLTVINKLQKKLFSNNHGYKYTEIINYKANATNRVHGVGIAEVEINKNCNLNCLMCKTWDSKRDNRYMDFKIFEKALAEAKRLGKPKVNIYTIGEPLLNPYLEDYLKKLSDYDLKAGFSTNGLLLHKNNNLELLCKYSDVINHIRFSVDGASKETYEKIRWPGKFERLIENLELFNDVNKDNFFRVKFNSVITTDNKQEIAKYFNLYSRYTDMFNIEVHIMNGLSPDNSYFFEASVLPRHIIKNVPCYKQLFGKSLHVLNNGNVTACCRDYHGDLIFGNIMESTPEELINNEKIIALRESHLNSTIPLSSLCNNCYRIDPRVTEMFDWFANIMVNKYKDSWDESIMQSKFNQFFGLFEKDIPNKNEFIKLCKQ